MSRVKVFDSEKNTNTLIQSITFVKPDGATLNTQYSNPKMICDLSITSFTPLSGISTFDKAEQIYIFGTTSWSSLTYTSTVGSTSYIDLNITFPSGWNIAIMVQMKFRDTTKSTGFSTNFGSFNGPTTSLMSTNLRFSESVQMGQRNLDTTIYMWGMGTRISMN